MKQKTSNREKLAVSSWPFEKINKFDNKIGQGEKRKHRLLIEGMKRGDIIIDSIDLKRRLYE